MENKLVSKKEIIRNMKPLTILVKHCFGNYEDVFLTLESAISEIEKEENAKVVGFSKIDYGNEDFCFKMIYFGKDRKTHETLSEFIISKLK